MGRKKKEPKKEPAVLPDWYQVRIERQIPLEALNITTDKGAAILKFPTGKKFLLTDNVELVRKLQVWSRLVEVTFIGKLLPPHVAKKIKGTGHIALRGPELKLVNPYDDIVGMVISADPELEAEIKQLLHDLQHAVDEGVKLAEAVKPEKSPEPAEAVKPEKSPEPPESDDPDDKKAELPSPPTSPPPVPPGMTDDPSKEVVPLDGVEAKSGEEETEPEDPEEEDGLTEEERAIFAQLKLKAGVD